MTEITANWKPRSRAQIAARLAMDIPEGWTVNLGIGVPTLVADHVPEGREVIFHAENGILGVGPAPAEGDVNRWLINAGKQHVTLLKGGSYFHHADSFAMIRGRHLDLCVLGAYEVSEKGDLANWARSSDDSAPAVGGAMDLAKGARRLWVAMQHVTREGAPRITKSCSYPLTAAGCVKRIYTDLAVIEVEADGLRVIEMIDGLSFNDLQAQTGAELKRPA
ncbi:3-oxoacid CoA-transferase subunit B [Notoacmeibacter sp. MSK16QG-6]|uniref:3-oxoacid CoA-transferase subunit B n=1 Tax=Notoacmeibacter sp. MSK16QG-6 TaxID=2957982 RepID=UPI00209F7927|nr:3-oxoacid CoA-transferase subunit B [Notoacmeibacter sp. MSK16QG-6]MCP1198356.1 3-oxoacid CoA-transferase subunit B [Notoacmeibacter sp. MSK16QG-6]